MTKKIVTCKKCGKIFDYMKTDGVCPKCARYYSTTNYNEEEAFLDNILAPANEEKCSYHGQHDKTPGMSGHSEESHHYQNRIDDQVPFFRNAPSRPNKNVSKMAVIVTVAFIVLIEFLVTMLK